MSKALKQLQTKFTLIWVVFLTELSPENIPVNSKDYMYLQLPGLWCW